MSTFIRFTHNRQIHLGLREEIVGEYNSKMSREIIWDLNVFNRKMYGSFNILKQPSLKDLLCEMGYSAKAYWTQNFSTISVKRKAMTTKD